MYKQNKYPIICSDAQSKDFPQHFPQHTLNTRLRVLCLLHFIATFHFHIITQTKQTPNHTFNLPRARKPSRLYRTIT